MTNIKYLSYLLRQTARMSGYFSHAKMPMHETVCNWASSYCQDLMLKRLPKKQAAMDPVDQARYLNDKIIQEVSDLLYKALLPEPNAEYAPEAVWNLKKDFEQILESYEEELGRNKDKDLT